MTNEYRKDKRPFPDRSTGYSRVESGLVGLHYPEILPHSVLVIEKSFLATATFRPIPAGRPADTLLPCG